MAEGDDRQARRLGGDKVVHRVDVGDQEAGAVGRGVDAARRVRSGGATMAAMVVDDGQEARFGQRVGEAGIAQRVLGEAVIDLHHAGRPAGRPFCIYI